MDTIIEQMRKISLSENPLPLLIDMKSCLNAMPHRDVTSMFELDKTLSHIQPLFDILNSSNNEQISTCVDVLSHILTKINPRMSLENFSEQYLRSLNHPHDKVRLLALKQMMLCSEEPSAASLLVSNLSLLQTLIKSISDSSMENVTTAQKTLIRLCSYPNATKHVISAENLTVLQHIMKLSDSCRFHVYDVCVKISLLNEDSLEVMLSSGILNQLVNEVLSGDILTQLNALELISELASNSLSLKRLRTDGIVAKLSYLLSSARNDQMIAVLLPGLLKFFGHYGAAHSDILVEEESLALKEIMRISSHLSGDVELSVQLIGFETLCHIGSTPEGKTAFMKFSVEMEQSLKDFGSNLKSSPSEMKVRILESLAKLFYLPLEQQTEDLLRLLETWFEHLSEKSSVDMVYTVARQPFPEILSAALTLLESISLLPWGVQRMASEPGFFEWLLDRNSCKDKESKEIRYNIVSIISKHSFTVKSFLEEDILCRIDTMCKQGPFYVESELDVAFEKEN